MPTAYLYLFPAMWLGWAGYWWVSSRNVKPVLHREALRSRLSYVALLILAGLLLSIPNIAVPLLEERFPPFAAWPFVLAAVMTAAGLLFSVWARRYLGTNWSGAVTIKERHELVTSGPHSLVRHPIYTGALALWRKLRLEERWMLNQFGEAYRAYCRKVPALIPFLL